MTDVDYDAEFRELAAWDWVVFPTWGALHAAISFSDVEYGVVATGLTACGRRGRLAIPGILSRMGLKRCARCCTVKGYPQGLGSPKNSNECRSLVERELGVKS